ncbi:dihydroorotase family protein [Candidatus Micrarchaeota archaeon]|nr:dihydroorotase family protein [Candidatus Micrarchaeota archaeon]
MALIIKGGLVFLGEKFEKKEILINDRGIIEKIESGTIRGEEIIDVGGRLVVPGLIDPHVHLREPGQEYKEDFESGSKAAISGGFTAVMDMPNNKPPTTTKERFLEKIKRAESARCDIFFHFGGTDDNFSEVKKTNPESMKLYLGHTTGELMLKNPSSMERHFREFDRKKPIVLHACDDTGDQTRDLDQTHHNIEDAIKLAKQINRRVHIAHVSAREEVTIAKRFEGCTSEVTPHHLFLSKKDEKKLGYFAKVNPPLRAESDRLLLWSKMDVINCIATDHAPHTVEDKEEGAAGFPGLETSLGLMLEGANRGLIDKISIFQKMSRNVASAFNLENRGSIKKGFIGDITIIDPKKEWTVDRTDMYSKCRWTPFDGWKLHGKAETIVRKGELVYHDYEFC